MKMNQTILIVEDEPAIAENIKFALETEGYVGATRYELAQPEEGKAKYLALYEIETDDFDDFVVRHTANSKRKREQGRSTELLSVISKAYYRQTYKVTK